MQTIEVSLTGTSPLLFHSDQHQRSTSPLKRDLDLLTSKVEKKRTEVERNRIEVLEFLMAFHGDAVETGRVVYPSWNIVRSIADPAGLERKKASVLRGLVVVDQFVPVIVAGEELVCDDNNHLSPLDGLFNDKFVDMRMVCLGGRNSGRVPRVRPKFDPWQITAQFVHDEQQIDLDDLQYFANIAGRVYGTGDGRAIGMGRYTAQITRL